MNIKTAGTAVIALTALSFGAMAATVPLNGHTQDSVQSGCKSSGGVYFAPGKGGAYGCMLGNGNGVVCGGVGKYANTCSTFRLSGGVGSLLGRIGPGKARLPGF